MRLPAALVGVLLVALVTGGLAVGGLPASASEVQAVPTTLTLAVPTKPTYVGDVAQVTARLVRDDSGAPVAGAVVRFERPVAGAWQEVAVAPTDAAGRAVAQVPVRPSAADNRVRAVFDGTAELAGSAAPAAVVLQQLRGSSVVLSGATRVVDGASVAVQLRWSSADGRPVPGVADVSVRTGTGAWKKHKVMRFDSQGKARFTVRPRYDTQWKAVGRAGEWWAGDTSNLHRIDNRPPGVPVSYPAKAPRPKIALPRQPRAVGTGANGTASRIPDAVWHSMVGRSWRSGCPVGRSSLRLVQVNYWGYDGYRYRGELVVHQAIARKTINAFTDLYAKRLPVRAMYRVDRFGWSSKLGGADNYASMASGNTSAFNCRGVVGNPGVRSPHSYGRSIDLNTWENPYHSRTGTVPNTWWATRSHPKIGWRTASHPVVKVLRANGFRWTYGNADAHHFDG